MSMERPLRIFLVEDNALDAMVFQRILNKVDPNAELYHAMDGKDALDTFQSSGSDKKPAEPYLTLLDINMPGMNGHELLERLRGQTENRNSIVFMFTTSSSRTDIVKAYDAGANGYIVKPENAKEMGSVLQTLRQFWTICEPPVAEAGTAGAN